VTLDFIMLVNNNLHEKYVSEGGRDVRVSVLYSAALVPGFTLMITPNITLVRQCFEEHTCIDTWVDVAISGLIRYLYFYHV
jgi:hypothetical protein